MPYRIDLRGGGADALDRLIELGALDVDCSDGAVAALMPDRVTPADIASAVGVRGLSVSPARPRDDGSVWILSPRPIQVGRLRILPANLEAEPDALRLIDAPAFGSGLHPTTALCLEALEQAIEVLRPEAVLDVGTGSGVLALGALMLGVPRAVAIDIDEEALRIAGQNARLNELDTRLQVACGGPAVLTGTWPLVVANILAAPLIDMAPALIQRVAHHGRLVLSGIAVSIEGDVDRAYRHLGMRRTGVKRRAGWVALEFQASW